MNSRQKRSSGGYGLRRKVAKKRLDEDFEYYFSKIGSFDCKVIKEEVDFNEDSCVVGVDDEDDEDKVQQDIFVGNVVRANKSMKNRDSPEKRPRGRPRKVQVAIQKEPDLSDCNFKFVDLKEKRCRKAKVIFVDQSETAKAVDEISEKENDIVSVCHEEEVEAENSIIKRFKITDALLTEEITGLQEEEVSSLPEVEKENLPEEGVSLDSFSEERVVVPVGVEVHCDSGEVELFDGEDPNKEFTLVQKAKRKYRRNKLTQDTIRRLSQLSPDDKIECNECHKLLKPSSFRQHLRTHTGEKPFGCEVCEARFTRKGDVERHVRIVHNKQKPFKCCRCQRAFGDKKNLRWHLMNHDKKLFYVCEVCGFKFGKREYWENHVRFIHPLPGGLDPAETSADGDVDAEDERLQALTDSLLEDDESIDEPCQNNEVCVEPNIKSEDFLTTDLIHTLPVDCKVIKKEGLKNIPLKSFSNVLKVSRSKDGDFEEPSNLYMLNEQSSNVETVVIQINNSLSHGASKPVTPLKPREQLYSDGLIRVITQRNMMELVDDGSINSQPIVIDTHAYSVSLEEDTSPIVSSDHVVEVSVNETVSTSDYEEQEPSKIISIMLNEDEGGGHCSSRDGSDLCDIGTHDDRNNGSVQTLIEALLDAAHGENKVTEIVQNT